MSKPVGEETKKWQTVRKYDQLRGQFYRDIRPNHIFHLASPASTQVYSGTMSGQSTPSTALSCTEDVFITDICYAASTAGAQIYGLVNSVSTILPIRLGANDPHSLSQPRDAPLYKLDACSTIAFYCDSDATVTVFISGVIEPGFRYVETTSHGVS